MTRLDPELDRGSPVVPTATLAAWLGVSRSTAHAWAREGMPALEGRGAKGQRRHRLADVVTWLSERAAARARAKAEQRVAALEAALAGSDPAAAECSLAEARRRRAVAQARLAELEAEKASGRVVDAEELEQAERGVGRLAQALFLSWTARGAFRLAPITDPATMRARLREEVEGVLHEIANARPEDVEAAALRPSDEEAE